MKESTKGWIQYSITTLLGVAWAVFDRRAELMPIVSDVWPSISWLVVPAGYVAVGFSFGWATCRFFKSRAIKRLSALHADEIAELKFSYEERIAELMSNDARRRDVLLNLSVLQLSAIAHMLKAGSVASAPRHSDLEREMESLHRLGYADMVELAHTVSYWSLSPEVTAEASKDGRFYKLVKESMLLGRFSEDGSYVKFSDTKTVMLKAAMKKPE